MRLHVSEKRKTTQYYLFCIVWKLSNGFSIGTFNLRGSDVECSPMFLAYALMTRDETVLFVDPQKLTKETETYLNGLGVKIQSYDAVFEFLKTLSEKLKQLDKKLFISKQSNYAILQAIHQVSEGL
jgi:hypothetical protein